MEHEGYVLDLTGGRAMYVKTLNYQLNHGWLDKRTRRLVVEFTTYSPHMDVISVFVITFESTLGLLFNVKSVVCTTK